MDQASELVRKAYGRWRWPKPLWFIRGSGDLEVAEEVFRFSGVGRTPHHSWAGRLHTGSWEAPVLDFFSRVLRPGDMVIDIGAYVGAYTLLASRRVGPSGRVYAIEPNPRACRLLERNVVINRAANVTVFPYAVGATSGYGSLDYGHRGGTETHVVPATHDAADVVRVVSLADFCSEQALQPCVIKIDVEGAEADILSDAAVDIIAATRIVIVELHETALRRRGASQEELIRRLTEWGKRIVPITVKPGNGHIAVMSTTACGRGLDAGERRHPQSRSAGGRYESRP